MKTKAYNILMVLMFVFFMIGATVTTDKDAGSQSVSTPAVKKDTSKQKPEEAIDAVKPFVDSLRSEIQDVKQNQKTINKDAKIILSINDDSFARVKRMLKMVRPEVDSLNSDGGKSMVKSEIGDIQFINRDSVLIPLPEVEEPAPLDNNFWRRLKKLLSGKK